MSDGFWRLSASETALALPFQDRNAPQAVASDTSARAVLEQLLLDALAAPAPCYVMFSGGRDSSAVLAVAVLVARREGLPVPIPVTVRHPRSPESDERSWQETVFEHLEIDDRLILEFDGEQRILAEAARASLRRHGPVWPEAIQIHGAVLSRLTGGSLVTGEAGDFIIDGMRMSELRRPWHFPRPRRWELRRAFRAALPYVVTSRQRSTSLPSWLTPAGRDAYEDALTRLIPRHVRWDRQVREVMQLPPALVMLANFHAVVAEHGLAHRALFSDPTFVDAWAREGGRLGFRDRTQAFRHLVGDLLPDEVLRRSTKASFNSTRWGPEEDGFARDWDGSGIDTRWVDPDMLRADWLSPHRSMPSHYLLQVAWCAQNGIPAEGLASHEGSAA